jgi:sugar/nucleoside kinase (ribokinase family)
MRKVTCAGILVADLIAAELPKVSQPGEITFTRRPIETHVGGHAANVSVDLMRLGMRPGEVNCLGAVGNDLFGHFFEQTLTRHRVSVSLQRTSEARTSVDLILVVEGEDRRYHCDVGANDELDPDFVLRAARREPPWLFNAGGAGLMAKVDRNLARVLREVKKLGSVTFLSPVMPHGRNWDFLRKALPWIDVFHCNDLEATSLTGQKDRLRAIKTLMAWGPRIVLVSRGAEGVTAAGRNRLLTMKGFRVRTLDPTGAGDAFCAGFIRSAVRIFEAAGARSLDWDDETLAKILLEAQAAGAACVTGIGTTSAVTRTAVNRLKAAQGDRVRRTLRIQPM